MALISEIGSLEVIPVPVDKNNYLPLKRLCRYFPDAVGLFYEENEAKLPVDFDESDEKLVPPVEGWGSKTFYVVRASSRLPTPSDSWPPNPECKLVARIPDFFVYLMYMEDRGVRVCATIVQKDLAITASHCVPKNKAINDLITLYSYNGKPYESKLVFQDTNLDLAALQPVHDDFDVEPLPICVDGVGTKYFVLGYPIDDYSGQQFVETPSSIQGAVMTGVVRRHCIYGDSGGSKGFSGGPVISLNWPRCLIGVAIGGRSFPKSWPLENLLIHALTFCTETPRLKFFPANFVLGVLTATKVERRGLKRQHGEGETETVDHD